MLARVARSGRLRLSHAGAKILDELAHHAFLAQHLGHGQHQVGGCCPLGQLAHQLKAHHFGWQHGDRLAEHGCLGFDAAHTPAHDAQAIDHGRVRVGAHQGVGEGRPAAVRLLPPGHDRGQVLEVHLVDDAGGRRHDAEIVKGVLGPVEELVALPVALELALGVVRQAQHCCQRRRPGPSGR